MISRGLNNIKIKLLFKPNERRSVCVCIYLSPGVPNPFCVRPRGVVYLLVHVPVPICLLPLAVMVPKGARVEARVP